MAGWDNPMREFERLRIENAGLRAEVERLSAELAEAWDAGHRHRQRRGPDDCKCAAWSEGECACGRYGSGPLVSLADNPYAGERP